MFRLKEAFITTALTEGKIVIIWVEAFRALDSRTPNTRYWRETLRDKVKKTKVN